MRTKNKPKLQVALYVPERPGDPAARLIAVGAKFTFCTIEILGPEAGSHFKPPYEGQVLTVIGFKPRYVNNVVVQDASGGISLMPGDMVAKGLELESARKVSG